MGRRRREKKAAGKEAQGAVKCRTRKKGGETERGTVAFVSEASLGWSVAIRKEEVRGRR